MEDWVIVFVFDILFGGVTGLLSDSRVGLGVRSWRRFIREVAGLFGILVWNIVIRFGSSFACRCFWIRAEIGKHYLVLSLAWDAMFCEQKIVIHPGRLLIERARLRN